jgi:hypothetical protein
LKLTHVHEDGHASTSELATWLHKEVAPTFRFSEDAPGFYAPETLEIAVKSVVQAESAYECFCYSQRSEGDNDSTAALAIGLWAWKHGMNDELRKLVGRMARTDYELLTSLIGKT